MSLVSPQEQLLWGLTEGQEMPSVLLSPGVQISSPCQPLQPLLLCKVGSLKGVGARRATALASISSREHGPRPVQLPLLAAPGALEEGENHKDDYLHIP